MTFGNLINRIIERGPTCRPENVTLGMGATFVFSHDRRPGTVTSISTVGKSTIIGIQRDAVRFTGLPEGVDWIAEPNPLAEILHYRFSTHLSRWEKVELNARKRWVLDRTSGHAVVVGERDYYYCPEF